MITARVYGDARNAEHQATAVAFFDGLQHIGIDSAMHDVRDGYADCHVAVVFGVRKKHVPISFDRGAIIAEHRAKGRDVVVIEKGYVLRDRYYAAGLNGLNGRANFRNRSMPGDRSARLIQEGAKTLPMHDGDNVVVIGQVPHDASVDFTDHRAWCDTALAAIARHGYDGRGIVFRPHPLVDPASYYVTSRHFLRPGPRRPLDEELANAGLVVTFNSNTGVDALLAGCRVVAVDEGSMIFGVAMPSLPGVLRPLNCDDTGALVKGGWWVPEAMRRWWLNDLAYAQWTREEMAVGLPWLHLFRGTTFHAT